MGTVGDCYSAESSPDLVRRGKGGETSGMGEARMLDWSEIDAQFAHQVDIEGLVLNRELIERFAHGIADGSIGPESNLFEHVAAAGPDRVQSTERFSPQERARYVERGREAIAAGRVAMAVLNGGMATRFGGEVKGIVEAVAGRSFLEIKLAQARALGDAPFLVMNSFATHKRTLEFLARKDLGDRVETFLQDVSLRLTPRGDVFHSDSGQISLYAPGHGDFPEALRRAGLVERLRGRGVELVQLSNIDNLGADLDPLLVGYHLERGEPLTAEVAESRPGDVGGTPAVADGRLQIVEGFRLPPGFDFSSAPFLATNTFLISLELLAREVELSWFYVTKQVDGRAAVQMERLVNELTSFVDAAYLATPRDGRDGRFFPIKTRDDLERLRAEPVLVERFAI